jgi:hypothetical protein
MGAAIFKQPNGLYGRYSYTSDDFTNYNMTKEEYIVSCAVADKINTEEWDFKHNQHFTDYERVKEDAIEYCDTFDEWIKDASKKEKEELRKEKEEELKNRNELISIMEKKCENISEHEYWKQVYELLQRLVMFYDNDWNRKDYIIVEHEEDMKMITQKVKEINESFDAYKNLSKKK